MNVLFIEQIPGDAFLFLQPFLLIIQFTPETSLVSYWIKVLLQSLRLKSLLSEDIFCDTIYAVLFLSDYTEVHSVLCILLTIDKLLWEKLLLSPGKTRSKAQGSTNLYFNVPNNGLDYALED